MTRYFGQLGAPAPLSPPGTRHFIGDRETDFALPPTQTRGGIAVRLKDFLGVCLILAFAVVLTTIACIFVT
jgi:hypothetical protein